MFSYQITLAAALVSMALTNAGLDDFPVIDLTIIEEIESGGHPDPDNAVSSAGARGRYQLTEGAVTDVKRALRVRRDDPAWRYWESVASNPDKAVIVADVYLHYVLPRQLIAYDVPVTTTTILAAYNAGARRVRDVYHNPNGSTPWMNDLPSETVKYIRKYESIEESREAIDLSSNQQ